MTSSLYLLIRLLNKIKIELSNGINKYNFKYYEHYTEFIHNERSINTIRANYSVEVLFRVICTTYNNVHCADWVNRFLLPVLLSIYSNCEHILRRVAVCNPAVWW